ncbi:hypothetical protein GDO81_001234 [Engystomops pustulosus]|uniref:Transcription factor JunD n=1 Tax=Engystomops pustulosus TaxID=76066 RepID=A0AAV7DC59_ENGPU|nr:hypothetical protein GDO81_001234 [Engystomops pustulosus]
MSFYHENVLNRCPVPMPYSTAGKFLKKDMNANINEEVLLHVEPHLLEGNGLVNSADTGLMNLASLDLERLIIQPNGMVTASPTGSHCLYPNMPIADGLGLPIEDLHEQDQTNSTMKMSSLSPVATIHPPVPSHTSVYTINNYVNEAVGTTVNYNTDHLSYSPLPNNMKQQFSYSTHRPHPVKDEPQIVPEGTSFGDSPPLSPINMDKQERIKAERKKLRNRIAASKCRKRKLERISRIQRTIPKYKIQMISFRDMDNIPFVGTLYHIFLLFITQNS